MSVKVLVFYSACGAASLILLPLLAVGGAVALMAYALITELSEALFGRSAKSLDSSTAREIARRLCLDHN